MRCNVVVLCEAMRRWKGEWHKRTERLTPGYLYVETSDVEKLALLLRRVPAFTKLLGNNEVFIPLNDDEVAWLNAFTGDERRVVEMSEGILEGSKVIVLRGPLMGHEAESKRIDRHRRTAELEIRMLGRVKTIRLGLEIVSKSPAKGFYLDMQLGEATYSDICVEGRDLIAGCESAVEVLQNPLSSQHFNRFRTGVL